MKKMYTIEFIRGVGGRDEPEIVDVQHLLALGIGEVIDHAAASLRSAGFEATPDTFRIRVKGGQIVYSPTDLVLVVS